MTIKELAEKAQHQAYSGDTAGFTESCFSMNTAIREEGDRLGEEDAIALSDMGAASMTCDMARHLVRAADALCFMRQPMGAAALLKAATSDPALAKVEALRKRYAQVSEGISHANNWTQFRELHAKTEPPKVDVDTPRVKAELAAARAALASAKDPPLVLSVGCGRGVQERALLHEFPTMQMAVVDLSGLGADLAREYPSRVTVFDPSDRYALPTRPEGYDLVVCFDTLQQQPNVLGFLAFLQEQAAAGVYSVPEALVRACVEDRTDGPYTELNGFSPGSLVAAFDRIGIEGVIPKKTVDGYLVVSTSAPREV